MTKLVIIAGGPDNFAQFAYLVMAALPTESGLRRRTTSTCDDITLAEVCIGQGGGRPCRVRWGVPHLTLPRSSRPCEWQALWVRVRALGLGSGWGRGGRGGSFPPPASPALRTRPAPVTSPPQPRLPAHTSTDADPPGLPCRLPAPPPRPPSLGVTCHTRAPVLLWPRGLVPPCHRAPVSPGPSAGGP